MTVPVLTEEDFQALSANAEIKKHLRFITPDHRKGCGCYLIGLPVWLIFALWGGYALDRAGLYPSPWVLNGLLLIALLLPLWPIFRVRRHMRRPVLDQLAKQADMDYASEDFEMKSFETALPVLFGDKAVAVFTDLLAGKEGGNSYAVCRAEISVGEEAAFAGLLHWFGRRAKSGGVSAVLPPGKAGPAKLQKIETGDSAFQAWSDKPDEARTLMTEEFRACLSGLAAEGPVYAYLARNDAFLLSTSPAAFEPEEPPADREARLRIIFDSVAAAFRTGAGFPGSYRLMIRFGAWSVFLLVFAAQALVLAAGLFRARTNRLANRLLALLLIVIAGLLMPFVLGYAGFYDAYPWLSFAPFAVPLAVGPLVYAHILALTRQRRLNWVHFLLPAAQFLYQLLLFPLPIETKNWFDAEVQRPLLAPILAVLVPASMLFYALAAWREAKSYRTWLAERRRDPAPARRLRSALAFLALLATARIVVAIVDAFFVPLDYFDLFAFYVLLAIASSWLGIEGLRRAEAPAPPQAEMPERDWTAQGREWLARIEAEGWWRDPEVDVAGLARALGTNSGSLSRAINAAEGSVSAALARMRCEHVTARLRAREGADLLALALESGFGSKASFNRLFRARFGVTPSAYRAKVSNHE